MSARTIYRELDPASRAQAEAARPDASVWVSANAGSGKTRVLTTRVARLLLAGAAPQRILCLTYTKAAAAEMQTRLFRMLGGWAMMSDDKLASELDAMLAEDEPPLGAEAVTRARRLFAETLETPGGLRIQTIHAFCESLLGRFPLEAGVSPHASVIDDATAARLRAEACDQAVLARAEDPALSAAFDTLFGAHEETGLADMLRQALSRHRVYDPAGIEALAAWLEVSPDVSRAEALARWRAGLDEAKTRMAADALLAAGGANAPKFGEQLNTALAADSPDAAWSVFSGVMLTGAGAARARIAPKALATEQPAVEDALTALQADAQRTRGQLLSAERFEATAALMLAAQAVLAGYRALKAARAGLDYDDLIDRAVGLLARPEARDWLRFKLDGGVDHLLVDEAQDTSPRQWLAVRALARDVFDGDAETLRSVFAVGDEKQSIYSFQGAAPALLSETGAEFAKRGEETGRTFRRGGLETSFRSAPAVLSFVDRVFASPETRRGLSFDGSPVLHRAHRASAPGKVEIWPLLTPLAPEAAPPWDAPLDAAPPDNPEARLARLIAETISAWIGREPLPSHGRPMRAGDVLVLVRGRGRLSNGLIKRLKQLDVPVAGQDRLFLNAELAVKDLLALARFCLFPDDDLTLATLLRSPFCDVDETSLFDLAHRRVDHRPLWRALRDRRDERPEWASAEIFLERMIERSEILRPFELFAQALGPMGGRARLTARLGPEAEDPIDEFLGQTLAFEADNPPVLQGVVEWIAARDAEIKREHEHGRNEVRVMTAHGAKGLEAPVVILPDCTRPAAGQVTPVLLDPKSPGVPPIRLGRKDSEPPMVADLRRQWAEAEAEEHRRLLYVALTRAEDRLLICGAIRRAAPPEDCWYRLCETAMGEVGRRAPSPVTDADGAPLEGWIYETVTEAAPVVAAPSPPEPQAPLEAPAWLFAPAAVESGPADIRPSHLVGEEPDGRDPDQFDPHGLPGSEAAMRRGELIHLLLERLCDVEAAARPARGETLLAAEAAEFPAEKRAQMLGEALRVLAAPDLAALFAPGGRAEVPVTATLTDLGPAEIHGVIDRLVITPERITIVDFKTGARPAKTPEAYLRQLAAYRAALALLYPDRPIAAALVWTSGPSVTPLGPEALDAAYARAAAEVERRRAAP